MVTFEELHELAGVQFVGVDSLDFEGWLYDPTTPHIVRSYDGLRPLGLHELAHRIVASKKALQLPNWGLGHDVNIFADATPETLPQDSDEFLRSELRACVMNIALAFECFGAGEAADLANLLSVDYGVYERENLEAAQWCYDHNLLNNKGLWSRRVRA